MNKPGMVKQFARTAADYGKASYQYHESLELVKREKESLQILRKWAGKPQTRKVSAHASESLEAGNPLDATAHLVGLKELQVSARGGHTAGARSRSPDSQTCLDRVKTYRLRARP
jgi:hypothetical protein